MKVTVIIPAYKARNYLSDSLASVAVQTFRDLEVLVVDDESPEPIDDLIEEYRARPDSLDLRVIRHERNAGLGAARNTGIREAVGDWVALLDHDDVWAPDHLESLCNEQKNSGADLVFCTSKQFRQDPNDELGLWGPGVEDLGEGMAMAILAKSFITPSSTLIRRAVLLECGGFDTDPKVHMCEDQDLWLRLLEKGARFSHVSKPTCYYRKHDEAATSRVGYMSYQSAFVVDRHASRVRGSWFARRALVAGRWWQAWLAFLSLGKPRWDVLVRAIWTGLPVPWEIGRGLVRSLRLIGAERDGA